MLWRGFNTWITPRSLESCKCRTGDRFSKLTLVGTNVIVIALRLQSFCKRPSGPLRPAFPNRSFRLPMARLDRIPCVRNLSKLVRACLSSAWDRNVNYTHEDLVPNRSCLLMASTPLLPLSCLRLFLVPSVRLLNLEKVQSGHCRAVGSLVMIDIWLKLGRDPEKNECSGSMSVSAFTLRADLFCPMRMCKG